uniref:Cytoplasmic dynein 1 intermediate chain 2 n=1 Tax=Plectus sambesii TaxID=2011161 RepID=A0A914UR22_9BILA
SPLSTTAHTHPIYSLTVVGTQNAHNLISVSTDGRLCSWSIDNLNQPQEAIDLTWKGSKQVASTCLSFPLNDVNNFVVGGEEGTVYTGCRHGSKAGVVDAYDGHYAPISGVDCHQAVGPVDFSQLFLTSSFDWTVKLWSTKEAKPLCSFENHNDYVLDVAWSPAHPALFACVDGQGKLDVWNMNEDAESPAASLVVEGSPALNKVMWMANGQQLVVGDNSGKVWLYDVHESLANPRQDEWTRLTRTLNDIRQAAKETEELNQTLAEMNQTSTTSLPQTRNW